MNKSAIVAVVVALMLSTLAGCAETTQSSGVTESHNWRGSRMLAERPADRLVRSSH